MSKPLIFHLESSLVRHDLGDAPLWFAANAQGLPERAKRLCHWGLMSALTSSRLRPAGIDPIRARWACVQGISEDRLQVLAQEYHARRVRPYYDEKVRLRLQEALAQGERCVLIGESIELLLRPLLQELGIQEWLCNRLEFDAGRATGRLESPLVNRDANVVEAWLEQKSAEGVKDESHAAASYARNRGWMSPPQAAAGRATPKAWLRRASLSQLPRLYR